MKYLSNLVTILVTFSIVLSSCSISDKQSTLPNKENIPVQDNKANTFKAKSLETKANEDFRIKILSKSENEPIEIKSEYEKPLVSDIEFNTFNYKPEIRKPFFHKALTKAEIKAKRKEARRTWLTWHKERQRKLRQELKAAHKDQRIYQKDVLKLFLSIENKGSEEYNNLLQEQITLRQQLIDQQQGENQALKDQYKDEIKSFKELLIDTYPKTDNNNVYVPKDKQPCKIDDLQCDPFEDTVLDNDFPEDQDYTYYKEDDDTAYKYDNTYVDGQPYFDSYTKEDGNAYLPEIDPTYFENLQDNTQENPQGFSTKKFKTLAASCQNVVGITQLVNNKVITSVAFKDQACKTFFTSIVEVESLPDGCANKNKISFSGKGVSFKAEIPIQLLTKTVVTRIKIKDADGIETTVSQTVTTLPDTGAIKITPVERPTGATVQSLTEKNVYSIDNTTGEFINFKLKDSSGAVKMEGSCLSMTKGTIDIFKKDLATDNYKLEFYRASSPNFVVAQKIVKITNAKVSMFMTNSKNYIKFDSFIRKNTKLTIDALEIESINQKVDFQTGLNLENKTIKDIFYNSEFYQNIDVNKISSFRKSLNDIFNNEYTYSTNINTCENTSNIDSCSSKNPTLVIISDLSHDYNLTSPNVNTGYSDYEIYFVDNSTGNYIIDDYYYDPIHISVPLSRGYINLNSVNLNHINKYLFGKKVSLVAKPTLGRFPDNRYSQWQEFLINVAFWSGYSLFFGNFANNLIPDGNNYDERPYITQKPLTVNFSNCQSENTGGNTNPTPTPYTTPSLSNGNIQPSSIPTPSNIPNILNGELASLFAIPTAIISNSESNLDQIASNFDNKIKSVYGGISIAANEPDKNNYINYLTKYNNAITKAISFSSSHNYVYELGKGDKPAFIRGITEWTNSTRTPLTVSYKGSLRIIDNKTGFPVASFPYSTTTTVPPLTTIPIVDGNNSTLWYGRNKAKTGIYEAQINKTVYPAGPFLVDTGDYRIENTMESYKTVPASLTTKLPEKTIGFKTTVKSEYPNYVSNGVPKEPRMNHIKERHMVKYLNEKQYEIISNKINEYSNNIKDIFKDQKLKTNIAKRDRQLILLYNNLRAYIVNDDPYSESIFVPKSLNCFPENYTSDNIYQVVKSVANFNSVNDNWFKFSNLNDEPKAYITGNRDNLEIETRVDNKTYGYGVVSTAYPKNTSNLTGSQQRDIVMVFYLNLVTRGSYSNDPNYLENNFLPNTQNLRTLVNQ